MKKCKKDVTFLWDSFGIASRYFSNSMSPLCPLNKIENTFWGPLWKITRKFCYCFQSLIQYYNFITSFNLYIHLNYSIEFPNENPRSVDQEVSHLPHSCRNHSSQTQLSHHLHSDHPPFPTLFSHQSLTLSTKSPFHLNHFQCLNSFIVDHQHIHGQQLRWFLLSCHDTHPRDNFTNWIGRFSGSVSNKRRRVQSAQVQENKLYFDINFFVPFDSLLPGINELYILHSKSKCDVIKFFLVLGKQSYNYLVLVFPIFAYCPLLYFFSHRNWVFSFLFPIILILISVTNASKECIIAIGCLSIFFSLNEENLVLKIIYNLLISICGFETLRAYLQEKALELDLIFMALTYFFIIVSTVLYHTEFFK